jgi:hydroxyethylthiazole kinase-like uncharacterized protein yjeF
VKGIKTGTDLLIAVQEKEKMKVVTSATMREIDKGTIEEYGIPGTVLMERAGLAVVSRLKELFGKKRVVVVAGPGNNGGDGIVVAKELHNEGWDVEAFLISRPENLKGDALSQYNSAVKLGVRMRPVEELLTRRSSIFRKHSVIIDAIFGTGLSKNITGRILEVIRVINGSGLPIISVDIPSGVSSDDGQVMGDAVKADCTVTFGLPKRGHLLYPGAGCAGTLMVEDIGFPREFLTSERIKTELLEKDGVSRLVPERKKYSHKGNYGHVLIVAGSKGKTGAAFMAAKACLRTGAGLVTIGVPESLADVFQSRVIEEMVLVLPDRGDGSLSEKASKRILDFVNKSGGILAIGPGIGVSVETEKMMKALIRNALFPMVVDADGINSLAGASKILTDAKSPLILTPHPGEMARLIGKAQKGGGKGIPAGISLIQGIEKDRIGTAVGYARETGAFLVLKGVPTVIATPEGNAFINPTGNAGMAKGGSGDVLTGMISGFLSQTRNPMHSCILGVYMHGLAADIGASEKGQHSLIATDIIDKIPAAFFSLKQGNE